MTFGQLIKRLEKFDKNLDVVDFMFGERRCYQFQQEDPYYKTFSFII